MTTPAAMDRMLQQDEVPPSHTANRPPQLNPTVTGPQSRCDPRNPISDDGQAEAGFEVIEVISASENGENEELANSSSTLDDIDDIDDVDDPESSSPYLFYVLPLTEEHDNEEDAFLLVIPYWHDGLLGLSHLPDEDRVYPWTHANPDPNDFPDHDDMPTEGSYSVSSSRVNSAILNPFDFAAHRDGSGADRIWSMSISFMSSSSTSSSGVNCSGWSESASIFCMYAETHPDDMVDGRVEHSPETLAVV
ncbi:hypothetical protein GX51_01449 [Blastomyces parvus]|uniref:Uncharacterized protein n=1 Tax=Blastomyces parvus TaxID=2060905 RepID=A0A2B7XGH6_9EURO|nr:hypothetical protein GX51_01449 [Blastomyces parvus]